MRGGVDYARGADAFARMRAARERLGTFVHRGC